ncbi:MAG: hypothetical protein Q9213_008031 [Squamulea squamosa]
MTAMPRTHRRRREKKLMTMEEVNKRFPLTKYKAWMATRAEEGLPTAGGVAVPQTPTASLHNLEGATSTKLDPRTSHDRGPISPSSSAPQDNEKMENKVSTEQESSQNTMNLSKDKHSNQHTDNAASQPSQSANTAPQTPPAASSTVPTATQTPAPTRQEVHEDNDMDDDDQIQIAVPTELLANPGDSCAICIDTLEDDDDIRGLSCGHAFHASCLDPWLTSRRACCPLCKADYYVPKPRAEGDAAAEADRNAGRRPQGMAGARIDAGHPHHYTFMNRRNGRPRMLLPGRFMAIGRFDDRQPQRYGFPTAQRQPRPSGRDQEQNLDAPEIQSQQPNTWRSRLPTLTVPRPSFPNPFRRGNAVPSEQATGITASDRPTASPNPTPGQLEADSIMDVNEQDEATNHESPRTTSQEPNGHSNPNPSAGNSENHPNSTSTSNEMLFDQSNNQPNGTQDDHAIGGAETQTPPSGQGNSRVEELIDPKELLEPFGWDDLEERFVQKMDECQKQEEEIEKEFREWCHVFQAWASTTREHEEDRLHKRLKTRMAWVRNSENTLEEKRQHYIKVVQAFESALALLGGL